MTLTEFLLARIAEDEELARQTIEDLTSFGAPNSQWVSGGFDHNLLTGKHNEFIAAYSPERALAECEAKRRIVAESVRFEEENRRAYGVNPVESIVARALALPYADHPDYQQEWAA